MTREDRRNHRKLILQALESETGSSGGDAAEPRVTSYIQDPLNASTEDFAFVGALTLRRFFIDPDKPNTSERRSLWQEILTRFAVGSAKDPGGWDGSTIVSQLQITIEQALKIP